MNDHGRCPIRPLRGYIVAKTRWHRPSAVARRTWPTRDPVRWRLESIASIDDEVPLVGEAGLLALARVVVAKHEALAAANGQGFSLFTVLRCETDEVRTHSAVIAELLNPRGSHGQGATFAQLFACRFGIDCDVSRARVWREVKVDGQSRIDILLQQEDTCVVVENKIHAGDQPRQLERYYAYASKWPRHRVLYLTLHGDEPDPQSLGSVASGTVESVSYADHVLPWLSDCIKEVATVPQVREILVHYQTLVRKLTGKSTGELVMDLSEVLEHVQADGTYNFQLIPGLVEAMTAFSIQAEWKFWQTLKERVLERGDRSWKLTPVKASDAKAIPVKEVDQRIIEHAHGHGNKNKWEYGWTFHIESADRRGRYGREGVEVLVRIECSNFGWGRYGFIAAKRTSEGLRLLSHDTDPHRLVHEWRELLPRLEGGWHVDTPTWIAWAYPTTDVNLRKSSWLDPHEIRRFVRDEAAEPLVADVCGTVDAIDGSEWSAAASDVTG